MKLAKNTDCVVIDGVAQEHVRELGAVLLRLGYGVIKLPSESGFLVAGEKEDYNFSYTLHTLAKYYRARVGCSIVEGLYEGLVDNNEFNTFDNYSTLAKQCIDAISRDVIVKCRLVIGKK